MSPKAALPRNGETQWRTGKCVYDLAHFWRFMSTWFGITPVNPCRFLSTFCPPLASNQPDFRRLSTVQNEKDTVLEIF